MKQTKQEQAVSYYLEQTAEYFGGGTLYFLPKMNDSEAAFAYDLTRMIKHKFKLTELQFKKFINKLSEMYEK